MANTRRCFVPMCHSTSKSKPDYWFLTVPKNRKKRIQWFRKAKRRDADDPPNFSLYACEAHFNLKEDLDNYYEYLWKKVTRKRLKPGVLPRFFPWQKQKVSPRRIFSENRLRRRYIEDLIASTLKPKQLKTNCEKSPLVLNAPTQISESQTQIIEETVPSEDPKTALRREMASKLHLFMDPLSQPSRAVRMFLQACNIPHTENKVYITQGGTMSKAYAAINPHKKVPYLKHEDFGLAESGAIFHYIPKAFPNDVSDHWLPENLKDNAKIEEYMHWHHTAIRVPMVQIFRTLFLDKILFGKEPNLQKAGFFFKEAQKSLSMLQSHYLSEDTFICNQKDISVADLMAVTELTQLWILHYDYSKLNPKISTWIERIRQRINPVFDECHSCLLKLQQKEEPFDFTQFHH